MIINLPVENKVEIIACDLYIKVDAKTCPTMPIRTIEGQLVIDQFNSRLSFEIHKAIESTIKSLEKGE